MQFISAELAPVAAFCGSKGNRSCRMPVTCYFATDVDMLELLVHLNI